MQYVMVPLETYLRASTDAKYNPELPVTDQIDCLAYDSSWEFPKECLKFGELSLHFSFVKELPTATPLLDNHARSSSMGGNCGATAISKNKLCGPIR